MKFLNRLGGALGFLTILPVRGGMTSVDELARGSAYFPVAGFLIGLGCLAITTIFDGLLGPSPANALVILFLVVITGGLHIDGLADTADGFAGGRIRQRRLEIMRSGTSGPVGVAAVTSILLLKYSFLGGLGGPERSAAVLLVPLLARWPMVVLAWGLPPVRRDGLGQAFAGRIKIADLGLATIPIIAATAVTVYLWGYRYIAPIPILISLILVAGSLNWKLLGGVTGDTLGATVELSEAVLFGVFVMMQ